MSTTTTTELSLDEIRELRRFDVIRIRRNGSNRRAFYAVVREPARPVAEWWLLPISHLRYRGTPHEAMSGYTCAILGGKYPDHVLEIVERAK